MLARRPLFRLVYLACLALTWSGLASGARALPLSADSNADLASLGVIACANNSRVVISISGDADVIANCTFGLYNLNNITVAANSSDFKLQALMADEATVLREKGASGSGDDFYTYEVAMGDAAQLGIFVIENASLQEYSLQTVVSDPIFSSQGAQGNDHYSLEYYDAETATYVYSIQVTGSDGQAKTLTVTAQVLPGEIEPSMLASGFQLLGADGAGEGSPAEASVPEPASLAMAGLGLALAGVIRRRRAA